MPKADYFVPTENACYSTGKVSPIQVVVQVCTCFVWLYYGCFLTHLATVFGAVNRLGAKIGRPTAVMAAQDPVKCFNRAGKLFQGIETKSVVRAVWL